MQHINLNKKTILVTGSAGFIGANLVGKLLETVSNAIIIGVDNCNNYYEVDLKKYRLNIIKAISARSSSSFLFFEQDIADMIAVQSLFEQYKPSIVINLAAQAGVRYSIINPDAYINANIIGFYNILEACRHSYDNGEKGVEHLVFASSSSVYGGNTKVPFSETDFVDNPVSFYASTKKSNELFAHSYAKLFSIPCTGLRFFTVYGPAGRPDMAYFSFTKKLLVGEKIQLFNYGNCKRDFTYIDDIIEGIICVMQGAPEKSIGKDGLPLPAYNIYNIGNSKPESLLSFVNILSEELIRAGVLPKTFDIESYKEFVSMQPGDVPVTYADTSKLQQDFGFKPSTNLRTGLRKFSEWYKEYNQHV